MENKTATGVAEKAHGKKLDAPISYDYKWTAYTTIEELRTANDMLSDDEILVARNNKRQMKARNAAQEAAFDAAGIEKPTLETDDLLRLNTVFKGIMSSKKYTEEEAKALAATTLGLTWPE